MPSNDVQKLVETLMQEGVQEKERLIKEGLAEKERLIKEGQAEGRKEQERLVQEGRREIEKNKNLMLEEVQQHVRDLLPAGIQALEADLQAGLEALIEQAFQLPSKKATAFVQILDSILGGANGAGILPLARAIGDIPQEKRTEDIQKLHEHLKSLEERLNSISDILREDRNALSFIKLLIASVTLELARSQGTAYVSLSDETAQALAGTLLAFKQAAGQGYLHVYFCNAPEGLSGFNISASEDGQGGVIRVTPEACTEVISQWLSDGLRSAFAQAVAQLE